MTKTEYAGNGGCPQRDSVEHKEYAEAYSTEVREINEKDGADLLSKVLSRENLNKAYKKVRANKGAAGIDGMTVEEALPWLKEHREELLQSILRLIRKYLKSGVMENGIICKTEEGSPQGGPLSPLLANIYLHEFDAEMERRSVKMVRYADDIVV